jgi:hypothetical protein
LQHESQVGGVGGYLCQVPGPGRVDSVICKPHRTITFKTYVPFKTEIRLSP